MKVKFSKGKKFFIWTRNPRHGSLEWQCSAMIVSPGLTNLVLPTFYNLYGIENVRCFDKESDTPETK